MSIEILTAAFLPGGAGQQDSASMDRTISLGPSSAAQGAQGPEAGRFAQALDKAEGASGVLRADLPAPFGNMLKALDGIDVQARSVTDFAQAAQASNGELTPGEIVQLTMKCQEFMFQCQLTSNIANRSADGLQQLFRQQG
ncbi:MAG: hypothetical protein AAGL68_09250 [Pseudomonadota bacterium]